MIEHLYRPESFEDPTQEEGGPTGMRLFFWQRMFEVAKEGTLSVEPTEDGHSEACLSVSPETRASLRAALESLDERELDELREVIAEYHDRANATYDGGNESEEVEGTVIVSSVLVSFAIHATIEEILATKEETDAAAAFDVPELTAWDSRGADGENYEGGGFGAWSPEMN